MEKVLIAAPVHEVLIKGLEAAGYSCVMQEKINQQSAYGLISDCVGVITSTRLQLDKELLDTAPQLRWIGRMGSGMEVIDLPYATEKGIACYSSPEGNRNAVAEHALGMLLALNKRIVISHNEVKEGLWIRDANRGGELEGKTIGLVGFGHTGRAFAEKLSVFKMRILAYDKYDDTPMPVYAEKSSLEDIFEQADIVSFHVPLQPDTVHYFNDRFITQMRKPFVLLNTSRGKVADAQAILRGVEAGKISGACLDVWEEEPLEKMSEAMRNTLEALMKYPQVIITPHIAGYSMEALYKMSKVLLDKIVIGQ